MEKRQRFTVSQIEKFLNEMFHYDVHAKRVYSLANATLGVLTSASLAVNAIGHGLAQARGLLTKHAIKQVDRLLSNRGIDIDAYLGSWVPYVVGSRDTIVVALDWTEFDADDHSTLALHLVTRHGRATPLMWKTVVKSKLKGKRNGYEKTLLRQFKATLPKGIAVTVLADRGFDDHKLMAFLTGSLEFDYVIRIRGNITVTSATGEQRKAKEWVGRHGRAKVLHDAFLTAELAPMETIVCVQDKEMKDSWCLVSSRPKEPARPIINYYAKRWSIEPSFRDSKDWRFGLRMSASRIKSTARRDRLFWLNAVSIYLLTLLGAAGEELGMDRHLKANTVKRRTHSLFRQGCMHYDLIPTMSEHRLHPLMNKFAQLLLAQPTFSKVFGFV